MDYRLLTPAFFVATVAACGETTTDVTPPPTTTTPTALVAWAIDIGNSGDASDIEVRVLPPSSLAGVAEFRVFLLDAATASTFDEVAAAAAPSSSYVVVPAASEDVDLAFPATATTSTGGAVIDGGSYAVRALSMPSSPSLTPSLSNTVSVSLARTNIVRTLTGPIPGGTGGMETDAEGNIYAADFGVSLDGPPGTSVYKITPDGEWSTWATGLLGASGNAFDSKGNLLQSNISGGTVSSITPTGQVSTYATGLAGGPVGIAVTPGDTAFVTNCGRNQLHRLEPGGAESVWVSSSLFNCPNGITRADDGNFYVANFGNGNVIKVTPNGSPSILANVGGNNNGHILFGNGVLYVVARGRHQIYQVTLEGTVTLLAGSGTRGLLDGAALNASLSLTNDVALSPDGRILYFNDTGVTTGGNRVIGPIIVRMLILDAETGG